MNAHFITELKTRDISDKVAELLSPLVYFSEKLNQIIIIPAGFQTDYASVPRVPIVYLFWGGRAHREAVLHDYLYRIDSTPKVSFSEANAVFLEAMEARNKKMGVRFPMYWGVCIGGRGSYHKKKVNDVLG